MRDKDALIREKTRELMELCEKVSELEASAKAAERIGEALRASEERFRRYFELGLIGMAITSPTKGMLEVNEKICEILGYERDELLQKTWAEMTHPDDLAVDVTHFNRVIAGGIEGYSIDKRFIRKGGQIVYATISVKCVRRADGSVDYFVALLEDITERRRIEEALRKREEGFRALAENSPDIIERFDEETRHIYVNPLAARLHGISAEELIGKTNQDLGVPEHYCRFWKERIQKVFQTGQAIEEENEFPTTNGKRIYQSRLVPEKTADGAVTSVLMVSRDITDRKRAEEMLLEYQKAIESSQDMIAVIDRNYRYIIANKAFLKYRAAGREQIIGRSVSEVLGKDVFEEVVKKSLDACFQGEVVQHKTKWTYPELGERDLSVSHFPIESSEGISRVAIVIRDITELKRLEERVRDTEMRRRLNAQILIAQENERKLIAREIHDSFASQLATVKYRVENFLQQAGDNVIRRGVESLEGVIPILQEGIMEVRRIQMNLRPSMLDDLGVLPTIEWFCRMFEETYPNIKVEKEIIAEEKEVSPSLKTVIYRTLQEAMNNSAKHSMADLVNLSLQKREGKVELLVRDNGRGFDLKRVVDPGYSRQGFGLVSMRERVELSGGSFSIDSTVGEGTTIRASWPLSITG